MFFNDIFLNRACRDLGENFQNWDFEGNELVSIISDPKPVVVLVGLNQDKNKLSQYNFSLNQLYHYFDAENFKIINVPLEGAFEIIRWEQPALTIIESSPRNVASQRLARRLRENLLTAHLTVAVWGCDESGNTVSSALPAQTRLLNERFDRVNETLQSLRPQARLIWGDGDENRDSAAYPSALGGIGDNFGGFMPQEFKLPDDADEDNDLENEAKPQSFEAASDAIDDSTFAGYLVWADLQSLMVSPALRLFVNEVLHNWSILQLAALLGENPEMTVNREILWQYLGLDDDDAKAAMTNLANAGYIEPLEYEGDDPLFAMVADPEKVQIIRLFSSALDNEQYRLNLTTFILSRERLQ